MTMIKQKNKAATELTHTELVQACRNIGFDLTCAACANQFYTGAVLGEHTCSRKPKYGLMHPSNRALGLSPRHDGAEMWGADDHPVLFDTIAEARARLAERIAQYPDSDWPQARVVRYTPGVDRVYPQWDDVPKNGYVVKYKVEGFGDEKTTEVYDELAEANRQAADIRAYEGVLYANVEPGPERKP